ncbi:ricin-type beta-trefoil lectin domain protein [Actinoplanes sp. CA-030573]|uniref:ricin-type beta-trefoil lectin domain protein n=1 Tax=Actinoplanes sp. CA-030573 TaxID=3239898 RepID=UPI003D8C8AF9
MRSLRTKVAGAVVLLLGICLAAGPASPAQAAYGGAERTGWMRGNFGLMEHWLAQGCPGNLPTPTSSSCGDPVPTPASWNQRVNAYQVAGVVGQLKSVGAGYFILAVGQNDGFWASPNTTYDKLVAASGHPSRLSTRDLIADMGTALHANGLKFIVYVNLDGPSLDPWAWDHLGGDPKTRGIPTAPAYQKNWINVLKEWATRWGDKVDGFFVDGAKAGTTRSILAPGGNGADPVYCPATPTTACPYPTLGAYYTAVAAAVRIKNPAALVALNPGGGPLPRSDKPVSDFLPGETTDALWASRLSMRKEFIDDRGTSLRYHLLAESQSRWGAAYNAGLKHSDAEIVKYSQQVTEVGGAMTWDVGYHRDTGLLSEVALQQMKKVGQGLGKLPGAIRGVESTRCVDVPGANAANGNEVLLYGCHGKTNQQWTFNRSAGTMRSLGKCLDVQQGISADGTPVQLFSCNSTAAQKWSYDSNSRTLKALGKCLTAGGTQDKSTVTISTCKVQYDSATKKYTVPSQQWDLFNAPTI